MDRDTVVIENTVDFEIANNDIDSIDNRDTSTANRSVIADSSASRGTNNGLIVTNSEADWELELSLKNDIQAGRSLDDVSSARRNSESGGVLTVAASIKAA